METVLPRPVHQQEARHPPADAAALHRLVGRGACRHRVRRQGSDVRHLQRLLDGGPRHRHRPATTSAMASSTSPSSAPPRASSTTASCAPGRPCTCCRPRAASRSPRSATARCSARVRACWCWNCMEHAKARGAKILAELCGFGMTSDSKDMVNPDIDGPSEAMRLALERCRAGADRHRLPERPRHGHHHQRPQRDQRHQAGVRQARLQAGGVLHQVDARPSAGRRRRHRGGGLHQGHGGRLGAADHRPRRGRPESATSTTCPTTAAPRRSPTPCRTRSRSAASTPCWCSARRRRKPRGAVSGRARSDLPGSWPQTVSSARS